MILPLTLLALAIVCRSISELALHGKLRWITHHATFWGESSSIRKYKYINGKIQPAPNNLYYRLFNVKYKERWPTSATFTVAFTDGMHLCQSLFFIFLSLSFSLATGLNFFLVWGGILLVHFVVYRIAQK